MKLDLFASAAVLALAAALPLAATAQDVTDTPQQPAQQQAQGATQQHRDQQVAEKCLQDLAAFRERMDEEGYWVSGYRSGYGWGDTGLGAGAGALPQAKPGVTMGTPAAQGQQMALDSTGTGAPAAPPVDTVASVAPAAGPEAGPWGSGRFQVPPGQELAALHHAGIVLGQRGNQEACDSVRAELDQAYGEYVSLMREAGVEPGQMVTWRQEQLAGALPVTETSRPMRIDSMTGTDVRNAEDAYLGSVEDLVFDPNTGEVSHVIVSRGGFLGLGTDYVAVPWGVLRVTPNFEAFVLNVSEDAMAQAPKVDPDVLANEEAYSQRRQEIEGYWQQAEAG